MKPLSVSTIEVCAPRPCEGLLGKVILREDLFATAQKVPQTLESLAGRTCTTRTSKQVVGSATFAEFNMKAPIQYRALHARGCNRCVVVWQRLAVDILIGQQVVAAVRALLGPARKNFGVFGAQTQRPSPFKPCAIPNGTLTRGFPHSLSEKSSSQEAPHWTRVIVYCNTIGQYFTLPFLEA